jgi:hypothetical protein
MGLYFRRNAWTRIGHQNTSIRARLHLPLELGLFQGPTRWESNEADFDPNSAPGLYRVLSEFPNDDPDLIRPRPHADGAGTTNEIGPALPAARPAEEDTHRSMDEVRQFHDRRLSPHNSALSSPNK